MPIGRQLVGARVVIISTLLYDMLMNPKNPTEIANSLIQQHGLDGAIKAALEGATTAGDNYALSVWREVKAILRNIKPDPKATRTV